MASLTDKLTDVRNAARPNSARVTSGRSAGGTTLACDNLSGWPTASKVYFVTYQVDSNSDLVAGTQLDCEGIVSGNSITSFTVDDGTDTGNTIGDYVVMLPTSAYGQALADWGMVSHTRTGVIKDGAINDSDMFSAGVVDAAAIAADAVGTSEIASASVTPNELATGATGSFVSTAETTTSTSYTALATGQSVTVTVGANGLLLVGISASAANSTANAFTYMTIVLSGANTLAANDIYAYEYQAYASGATHRGGVTKIFGGLTPGSTTVTVNFRVQTGGGGAGTGTWSNRELWVLPL